jgi:hypothetical protein
LVDQQSAASLFMLNDDTDEAKWAIKNMYRTPPDQTIKKYFN